uniref:Uncharacterized protein n=1 Tax=Arundo donax TaxID=35708 RepID=A0A0A9E5U7_ARUDO
MVKYCLKFLFELVFFPYLCLFLSASLFFYASFLSLLLSSSPYALLLHAFLSLLPQEAWSAFPM